LKEVQESALNIIHKCVPWYAKQNESEHYHKSKRGGKHTQKRAKLMHTIEGREENNEQFSTNIYEWTIEFPASGDKSCCATIQ
jgi:hypothetical protein